MKSIRLICLSLAFLSVSCRHTSSKLASLEATPGSCDVYPLVVPAPAANAKALATTQLKSLGSVWGANPQLNWSDYQGTPESLTQVQIPLELCDQSETTAIFDAISASLAKTPGIFHFNPKEWKSTSPDLNCSSYKNAGSIVSLKRETYAGEKIDGDEIKVTVGRSAGKLVITALIGWYLPEGPETMTAAMRSCANYDAEAVYQQLEQIPTPYGIFENCIQTGQGLYQFNRNDDLVTFSPAPFWTVFRDKRTVTLFKTVNAELEIQGKKSDKEKVFSDEIKQSDTMCTVENKPVAGFTLVVDGRSGQVYQRRSGIRNCLTCLQGK